MSLWKKTKELFKRLKGDDSNTPPPAPAADPLLPVFFETLPKYQQEQRDYAARAKAVTPITSGALRAGRNAAKRRIRAEQIALRGCDGGWKKLWGCKQRAARPAAA